MVDVTSPLHQQPRPRGSEQGGKLAINSPSNPGILEGLRERENDENASSPEVASKSCEQSFRLSQLPNRRPNYLTAPSALPEKTDF